MIDGDRLQGGGSQSCSGTSATGRTGEAEGTDQLEDTVEPAEKRQAAHREEKTADDADCFTGLGEG